MTNEDLQILDFILNKLSEVYPEGESIDRLLHLFKKEFKLEKRIDFAKQKYIEKHYESKYFEHIGNSNLIRIYPRIKEHIDSHGSLSKYIEYLDRQERRSTKRKNWLTIIPVIVAALMFCATVYFGISNDYKNSEIRKFKNELNKKDSIILELNKLLIKQDTIKH